MSEPSAFKTTGRALNAAVALYARWEEERERLPLDRIAEEFFRAQRALNSGERRWIAELVYSNVRLLRRTDALLEALGGADTPEQRIHLRAAELGGSALPAFLRFAPQEVADALATLPAPDAPADYLRRTLSFPEELATELEALLGAEALAAGAALNAQAPLTLRVNLLRKSREQMQRLLPEATPTRYAAAGLHLPGRTNLHALPGFREGWFEAQEEASQVVVEAMEVEAGQTVVEVGAGGGGKTLALAALMRNRGRLIALDTSEPRLAELRLRAGRAGVACAETLCLTTDETGYWRERNALQSLLGRAERVLIDAPCTGSGVLRRNPDAKWRRVDQAAMRRLQNALLAQSAELVAPNGLLFYVTCALERWQNEEVVAAFLDSAEGAGFRLEPATPRLPELMQGDFLRTYPHRHPLDAFFMARMRRE